MEQTEFRAWNPIEQEWEYYTLNDLCYNTNRPDICLEKWTQWTGLVDCKGNKIFEGDYLQGNKGESDKWLVIFNDKLSKFEAKFVGRKDSCIENKELYFVDRAFIYDNRFQNPELIKD